MPEEREEVKEGQASSAEHLKELEAKLTEERAQKEAYLANWQRAQADFINYRRQVEMERERVLRERNAQLIRALLPVLDNLERALANVPQELSENPWVKGIYLIADGFRSALKSQGVEPIQAVGKPFNPAYHEAIMQTEGEEGKVISELEKGYLLGDSVIRPTKAIVGLGEKSETTDNSIKEV